MPRSPYKYPQSNTGNRLMDQDGSGHGQQFLQRGIDSAVAEERRVKCMQITTLQSHYFYYGQSARRRPTTKAMTDDKMQSVSLFAVASPPQDIPLCTLLQEQSTGK